VPEHAQQHHGAEQHRASHYPHGSVRFAREVDDDVCVCGYGRRSVGIL
jgi:hypothetical protein